MFVEGCKFQVICEGMFDAQYLMANSNMQYVVK